MISFSIKLKIVPKKLNIKPGGTKNVETQKNQENRQSSKNR
jgi:hypothetical protein